MKRLMIVLSLILTILFSGCVDQTVSVSGAINDGVKINKFWFDDPDVYPGDMIGLNLELQNVGEVQATEVVAELFGSDWVPTDSKSFNSIPASEPEMSIEGGMRSARWRFPTPDVKTETDYSIGTRVIYKYNTIYTGTLRIVKDTFLETLPDTEREQLLNKGGIASSKVTGGPLSISPVKGRNFVVSQGETGSRTVVFEVTNVGTGNPSSANSINKDTMYRVQILGSMTGFSSCNSGTSTIRLSQGKSHLFSCDFNIPSGIVNKEDIIFTITFDYYYYVDDLATITVNPIPEI